MLLITSRLQGHTHGTNGDPSPSPAAVHRVEASPRPVQQLDAMAGPSLSRVCLARHNLPPACTQLPHVRYAMLFTVVGKQSVLLHSTCTLTPNTVVVHSW